MPAGKGSVLYKYTSYDRDAEAAFQDEEQGGRRSIPPDDARRDVTVDDRWGFFGLFKIFGLFRHDAATVRLAGRERYAVRLRAGAVQWRPSDKVYNSKDDALRARRRALDPGGDHGDPPKTLPEEFRSSGAETWFWSKESDELAKLYRVRIN